MRIDRTHILVLNYNGRALLRECLPSILAAAQASPVPCPVTVVDNGSTDGSLAELETRWPSVSVISCPNDGLASFNRVLRFLPEPALLLLNNDVKLARDAIAPLLSALEDDSDALFAAPQCWTFDEKTYEGMRTRVRMRFGLVQGMCRVPGHLAHVDQPALTAAAGPVLMVDRRKFLSLRGYDRLYCPGRIEDLDLGYVGWLRGWHGRYVPASRAYHKGLGTFEPHFGERGCNRLAARNTLLFSWKNLHGWRLWSHLAWLPARVMWSIMRRSVFAPALVDAMRRIPDALRSRRKLAATAIDIRARQATFFRQFRW